jgi:hypothetical protein
MRTIMTMSAIGLALSVAASPALATPTNIQAQQSTITYSTTGTVTSLFGNYARATSKVVYDPATDTYTVRDTGSLAITSSFGPSNINSGASNATFTVYSKNSGSETFRLLNQGAGNPLIQLTYVDYGEWKRSSTASGTTKVNDTYVVFGSKTPGASVPRSGGATYNTIYDGSYINKNGAFALNGTGSISANFATGGLGYAAALNGLPTGALAIAGSGSITFSSGNFKATGSSSGYSMSLYGGFYGPAAQEVGGLFKLSGNGGNGQGAFVGN